MATIPWTLNGVGLVLGVSACVFNRKDRSGSAEAGRRRAMNAAVSGAASARPRPGGPDHPQRDRPRTDRVPVLRRPGLGHQFERRIPVGPLDRDRRAGGNRARRGGFRSRRGRGDLRKEGIQVPRAAGDPDGFHRIPGLHLRPDGGPGPALEPLGGARSPGTTPRRCSRWRGA